MKDQVLEDRINKALARLWGRNYKGEPLFRVVWSVDQTEKRLGTFEDFYRDVVYLRTVTCVREVPKYSYLRPSWVLERWIPGQYLKEYHDEIPHTLGGSYEPIYVYQDVHGNPLPLNEEATYAIVQSLLNTVSPAERRSLDATEEARTEKKGRERDLMIMEEASPYLVGKLHGKEAVVVGDMSNVRKI